MPLPGDVPRAPRGRILGAETSTGTTQTILFTLGGLLLAGAVVVMTFAFTGLNAVGRMSLLGLITLVLLFVPVALARRQLIATAETLAAVALLMVLVDGYVAYSRGPVRRRDRAHAGVLRDRLPGTAAVAVAYEFATHLLAPRYATLLVLQPVIPLLGYPLITEPAGWALALVGVAADEPRVRDRADARPVAVRRRRAARRGPRRRVPARRRLAAVRARLRHRVARTRSRRCSRRRACRRRCGRPASWCSPPPSGVAGAVQQRRSPLADLTGGLAVLAVILAAARVAAVATPGYALVVTAGAVAATAVVRRLAAGRRAARAGTGQRPGRRDHRGWSCSGSPMPAVGAPIRAASPYWETDLGDLPGPGRRGRRGRDLAASRRGAAAHRRRARCCCRGCTASTRSWSAARSPRSTAPAALHLNWVLTPAVAVAAAIVAGVAAQRVGDLRRPAEVPEFAGPGR